MAQKKKQRRSAGSNGDSSWKAKWQKTDEERRVLAAELQEARASALIAKGGAEVIQDEVRTDAAVLVEGLDAVLSYLKVLDGAIAPLRAKAEEVQSGAYVSDTAKLMEELADANRKQQALIKGKDASIRLLETEVAEMRATVVSMQDLYGSITIDGALGSKLRKAVLKALPAGTELSEDNDMVRMLEGQSGWNQTFAILLRWFYQKHQEWKRAALTKTKIGDLTEDAQEDGDMSTSGQEGHTGKEDTNPGEEDA